MKLNKISSLFSVTKYANKNTMLFGTALTAMLSTAALAAEEQAPTSVDEDIEVIEVTGMLGSMKAAALRKRTDSRISDGIVAEDIGKLPDNNIAEALQRITGVSINTDFGVGDSVSIRGLPQNRVELNGRSTIGDSRGGISLQDFPSSFLKAVEVVKSPTADMIEGALGGTVSLQTVRPLELDGLTGAFSLDGEYADKTENWAPIFSGSIGNNWDLGDAGTFGALVMLSYQDREIRQDQFMSRVSPIPGPAGDLAVGGGNTSSKNYTLRDQHTVEQYLEQRERTAVNLSLQWAPQSGDGMVYLDLNTTEREGSQAGSSVLAVGGGLDATDTGITQNGSGALNNFSLDNDFAIPKTYSDFRETEAYSHALGGEWTLTDDVKISGEVAVASSESYRPDAEFTLRPIQKSLFDGTSDSLTNNVYTGEFSQSGDKLPSIIHSVPDAYTSEQDLALRTFKYEEKLTDNEETAIRFDIDIADPLGFDWLSSLKSGVRVTEREYSYRQYKEEIKDIYKNAKNPDDSLATVWIDDYNSAFPGSFSVLSHEHAFDQLGKSGQNDLLKYQAYNGLDNAQNVYSELQQLLAGTSLATTGSLADNLEESLGSYRDITEDTRAVYLSAYLDFDSVTAVVGGRYIETDLESSVFLNDEKITGKHEYDDFLPSLNVTYNATDNTLVRFAAAKVMRRADFGQLSPAFDIDNSYVKATQGSIDLDPYRATQFDLSIEHYFGAGNLVSFAVFYKDVESFLNNTNTCRADASVAANQNVTEWQSVCILDAVGEDNQDMVFLSTADGLTDAQGFAAVDLLRQNNLTGVDTAKDTNGENGTIEGFEVGYQQIFDFLPGAFSGLGISANYTYADSEQPNGNPLLDISENTYNLQLFWEYEGLAARLAYNYRDGFLDTENEKRVIAIDGGANNPVPEDSIAGNNYRDDRGQLDASASWNINEHFTVVANATNLTGEASIFKDELGNNWKYTEADRRYTIGVRAKF
ncbi:TonB-dependent receptor [Thalassotalea crassostreae]|uniref:TonB-dependent receptor n=1 Tax=Thalassotalea crassostreae TaxID=1763536 RepID=UPI0008388D10|nr:TonB-dependent receptor [Thalassotalea crassostreae]